MILHHNHLARVLFPNKTTEFVVEVDLVAELAPFNPFDFFLEPGVEEYPFAYAADLAKDLEPYLSVEPAGPSLREFLASVARREARDDGLSGRSESEGARRGWLCDAAGATGCRRARRRWRRRTGSCRDSAWLLVQILRHLGLRRVLFRDI